MKMENFTKTNIEEVRTQVELALTEVAKQLGITLEVGTISFNHGFFKASVEGKITSGDPILDMKKAFVKNARFTLVEEMFGTSFQDPQGEWHTIVEYNPRSRTYPVLTVKGRVVGKPTNKWAVSAVIQLTRKTSATT